MRIPHGRPNPPHSARGSAAPPARGSSGFAACACVLAAAVLAAAAAHAAGREPEPPAGPAHGLGACHRVSAFADPERREISGSVEIEFAHPGPGALQDVYLVLYPNSYLKPSPNLNDINYEWTYPRAFNRGFTEIELLTLRGSTAHEMDAGFRLVDGAEDRRFLRLGLNPPLSAGEKAVLRVRFRTRVPEKFGPFGCYQDVLTAAGGWYPALPAWDLPRGWLLEAPPAFSEVQVSLRFPKGLQAVVNGTLFKGEECAADYASPSVNIVSVTVGPGFHVYETEAAGVKFSHIRLDPDEGFAGKICSTARLAIEFFRKRTKRPLPPRIALVEARIRSTLTDHGGESGFVSDRLLRVLPYPVDLRKYHLREVAFEVFYMLFLHSVRSVERPDDYNWVSEGAAWTTLRRHLYERNLDFGEVQGLLKTFSFIPVIDQTLVAPRFPFNDVFFDTFFKSEPHRESVFRFNNRLPFGRIVVEKLKDALPRGQGPGACDIYIAGPPGPDLISLAERTSGSDLGWFRRQWHGGYPAMNYSVGGMKAERLGPGRTRVTIEIKRDGGGDFREYVDLGVVLENGSKYHGRVKVDGDLTVDSFVYPDEPDSAVVDPFGRCLEATKTDNSSTRSVKLLITSFQPRLQVSPDFGNLADTKISLDIWGGFAAIAEGDYGNQVFLNYFYELRGFGFNLGYMHSFGFKIDRTDFPQGLGAFIFFEKLDRSFARVEDEDDDGDRLVTASLRVFYTFDTRVDQRNPHSGAAFTVTAEYADKILGTDFRFATLGGNLRWLFSPARNQVFAFQVRAATSWGEMPRQRMFALGGYPGLRGIPENAVLGSHQLVLRMEYRHLLLNEMDVNFLWIGYIRRIGGALFIEAGAVTGHRSRLAEIGMYRASIGYGLKVAFDSFGVRPFIVGMDVAFRLDVPSPEPEIYFTIAQSF